MRMLRTLSPIAAAIALCIEGQPAHAAQFANPYEGVPRCPDDPGSGHFSPLGDLLDPGQELNIRVTDGALGVDLDTEDVNLAGNVIVQQGEHVLRANSVRRDAAADQLEVRGEVQYSNPQLVVSGEAGQLTDGQVTVEGARFELPQQPARGSAGSLTLRRSGVLTLENAQYTTCPEDKPDWFIKADRVEIDTQRRVGTARDARIQFLGVSLLRLPAISFPVGDARKSGLLFPSLGSSTNSGVQLSVPYYFNLAPEQDFTLTPTWYTSRGIDLQGEYRLLTRRGHAELLGNLLPSDRKANSSRSRLRLTGATDLPGEWRLVADAENVSDARYYEDFAQGSADGASIAFLPRMLRLAYRGQHVDAGVMLRNFQTLDQDLPQLDRPHTEAPRFYGRGDWLLQGALPVHYGIDAEAVSFLHSDTVQGWRFDLAPRVGLDFTGAGYFLRPTAALETTHYRLRDTAPGADTTPSRTLPLLSLDTGLQFERGSGNRGQRRITLEPRLMYLYAPFREQSDLPIFDTAEPDLNWVELFRTNRYVGLDRISDANQVSAGFTTQIHSSRSGARILSTTVGQVYYFESPQVRLPDEAPAVGSTSDLIAQVELSGMRGWNVSTGLQWDPKTDRSERAEVRLQYRPESRSVLNLGYRFQRDRLEQAEVSGAWPLSDQWRLYGRYIYSLRDSKSIEQFAGFEYSSCCWNLRAVARDYVSRRSGERDRSVYLQLELKGLSNVGQAADAFLQKAIRGYSTRRPR